MNFSLIRKFAIRSGLKGRKVEVNLSPEEIKRVSMGMPNINRNTGSGGTQTGS